MEPNQVYASSARPGSRRGRSAPRSALVALSLLLAGCGGSSDVTQTESKANVVTDSTPAVDEPDRVFGQDSDQDSDQGSDPTAAATAPPIGTPFVIGEVLVVDGISEIVGDGTVAVELAEEPGHIRFEVDGTVPVVDERSCQFCMGVLELGPGAVAPMTLFTDRTAHGTSVVMNDIALVGGMFPDDATQFIVAGDDGAVLEKDGDGFRLIDGAAWLVTDRTLIDEDYVPPPAAEADDDVAPVDASGFVDTFDGSLDDAWTWTRPDPSRHSLEDSAGWLSITAQEHFPATNVLLRNAPEGSFEMTTALRFAPHENFQFAGLIVVDEDETTFSQIGRAFCDADICVGDGIYFDNVLDGTVFAGESLGLESPVEIVHLRLTATGNEYEASFSPDGETWTVIGTEIRDFTTRRIGLVAHQAKRTEVTAEFAYFTLVELDEPALPVERDVQYVATGFDAGEFLPDVWMSTDLDTWERVDTGFDRPLLHVAWNGQHWIAVGNGIIATSADGRQWMVGQDMGDVLRFHDAAWGGSQWTVVGDLQILGNATSDWTAETHGSSDMGMLLFAVASNGEQWVAVGNGWQVLSSESPTGTAFARRHGAPQDGDETIDDVLWDVAWGDGLWVAVGEDGRMLVSLDGISWTDADSGTNERLRSVAHHGTTWMVTSGLGNVFTSTDGFDWERTLGRPDTSEIVDIGWDGCQWVAAGDGVHTSTDGGTWVRHEADVLISTIAVASDESCN